MKMKNNQSADGGISQLNPQEWLAIESQPLNTIAE